MGKLVRSGVFICGAVLFFALVFVSGPVTAGNSWMDQGKSLLKQVQGDSGGSEGSGGASAVSGLSLDEISGGLKEALEKGAKAVVQQLGSTDGYNKDVKVHIPLPDNLSRVKSLLDKAGMGSYAEEVELKLNRAAEAAVPKAKDLFVSAITEMRMEDVQSILDGPDDAATTYFRDKMSSGLVDEMSPVIDETLSSVGAVKAYDQMMGRYKSIPLVPDVKGDLTAYTAGKAVEGIFYYIAEEEKAIRENPAKRTTDLLKKVFK